MAGWEGKNMANYAIWYVIGGTQPDIMLGIVQTYLCLNGPLQGVQGDYQGCFVVKTGQFGSLENSQMPQEWVKKCSKNCSCVQMAQP